MSTRRNVRSIGAWKPLFAHGLARAPQPPRALKMRVGQGAHLLLYGESEYPLHIALWPARSEEGWYVSERTLARYTGPEELQPQQRVWLAVLRRVLAKVERAQGWESFLQWAADKPGTSLPSVRPDERRTSGASVLIRVHEPCNAACDFCSCIGIMPDYAIEHGQIEAELDGGLAQGATSVTFTGGEPTLRRDLPEVLALAARRGFSDISLQTNAVRLADPDRVRALRAAGLTSAFVSLHAHEAELHDRLLKLDGAFEGAVQGIVNLLDSGALVRINHLIQEDNKADVAAFARFAADRFGGRAQITWSFVAPIGWALEHLEVIPRLSEVRGALAEALAICRDAGMDCDIPGLCGMPICQLPDFASSFSEFQDSVAPPALETRQYFAGCAGCAVRDRCSGYWRVYAERHGESEFVAVDASVLGGGL